MSPTEGKRIVIVSRRFWPLADEPEMAIGRLADGFLEHGARPEILTARWDKHWPEEFVHRGVPVHRLQNSSSRRWGTLRYIRSVSNWLRSHSEEIDAVYVSLLRYDAYAAIGALAGRDVPVGRRAGRVQGQCFRFRARCATTDRDRF